MDDIRPKKPLRSRPLPADFHARNLQITPGSIAPNPQSNTIQARPRNNRVKRILHYLFHDQKLPTRLIAVSLAALIFSTAIITSFEPQVKQDKYSLSDVEGTLLDEPVDQYEAKLQLDPKTGALKYNEGYTPASGSAGQSSAPKITASFSADKDKAVKIDDPVNNVGVTFKPRFKVDTPQKNENRVVYPIIGKNASKVYTLKGSGVKEDIILHSYTKDKLKFEYDVELSTGLEMRVENDGSLAVYGADSPILGEVTTGSDKDTQLLEQARKNAEKNKLIFRVPAPFILEKDNKATSAKAWYEVQGNSMSVHASGLKDATYPLSIDPSVYVETAAKLMRGNNETNLDFDTTNELIQKGSVTGARIPAWVNSLAVPATRYGHSTAVAGGYMYTVGGRNNANATTSNVYWTKFNTATKALESPNPGAGACTNWCTNTSYNLPAPRAGLNLVAYSGYLYAIGGNDTNCTVGNANGNGGTCNTVFYAKIGANGEPISWSSTAALPVELAQASASAYNNKLYITGGTSVSSGAVATVRVADINPNGTIGAWSTTGMTNIPAATTGHNTLIYNDRMYVVGGSIAGAATNIVRYIKINTDGTLASSWVTTTPFTNARTSHGGSFTTIWGGYLYISGGCTSITGATCNTIAGDTQIASINADGSLTDWSDIIGLTSNRAGHSLVAWRNAIYGVGGCSSTLTLTTCGTDLATANYGVINGDGDVSTVNQSIEQGTGVCTGATPSNCHLPSSGNSTTQGGRMANGVVVNNGYIYIMGGCTSVATGNTCEIGGVPYTAGSTSYAALAVDGTIVRPATCNAPNNFAGTWCVDSTNVLSLFYNVGTAYQSGTTITGIGTTWTAAMIGKTFRFSNGSTARVTARGSNTSLTANVNQTVASAGAPLSYQAYTGLAAFGTTVYNNTIYAVGGTDGTEFKPTVQRVSLNSDGTLSGAWTVQTFANLNLSGTIDARAYSYVFARSNPTAAATYPGNLYVLGGCRGASAADDGLGCSQYATDVFKCNIGTTGALEEANANDCVSNDGAGGDPDQLQIDSDTGTAGNQGLGLMSGTVYANYVYLIAGSRPGGGIDDAQLAHVMRAKIDDSNNIVAVSGTTWITQDSLISPPRRRGYSFGSNGYLYTLAGHDGSQPATLNDLRYAKINVSDGSVGTFALSSVAVVSSWDFKGIVANGYVYAFGGCITGNPPADCTGMTGTSQTFQIYNNYSGSPGGYSVSTNSYTSNRSGAASTVLNGYIYIAGGCQAFIDVNKCDTNDTLNTTQYAPLNPDGTIGTWLGAPNLPGFIENAQMETVGGTLYFIGGDTINTLDDSVEPSGTIYYATPNASGVISSWQTATNNLPQASTELSAAVWNNRIYVTGGDDGALAPQSSVYVSPSLSGGGNISSAWTSTTGFNVARSGHTTIAYANNLYVMGGWTGTQYLNDVQYAKINSDGTIGAWSYSTSLPRRIRNADGFAANGYMYLFGGRSDDTSCTSNTYVAGISANTTVATGNNPTGIGDWSETNVKISGSARKGVSAVYDQGKAYVLGGDCNNTFAPAISQSVIQSQPMTAKYSRMIDTDTDVFPTKWLMNGLDNDVGARWKMRYRSSTSAAASWGQETNFGTVTLEQPENYIARDGAGVDTNFARYYYLAVSIDSSQAFGYPEDVSRGPTIDDLSLFFTADPSKRLRHGKTFTGGEQQPLDTPFP